MDYIQCFYRFKADSRTRYSILLLSIIGTAYGFYYYEWQLRTSPIYYWPLIPDSPFFTLMYVVVLAAYSKGKRSNLFDVFTFIGLNKIGFWTLFVLLYDFNYYFSPDTWVFRSVLFLLHIGMILCSFTLLKEMKRPNISQMGILLFIFLGTDYFDYVVGTHPYLHTSRVDVIAWIALLLTLSCWGSVWLIRGKKPQDLG